VTGRFLDAATAHSWGLVDEVVPRSQLEQRVRALAR
jgi:enoyl-CoA hydratase/carnithine racemase